MGSTIDARVLASKTIFRIRWRLFLEYLAIEDTAWGIRLRVKLKIEGPKSFFSLSILLSISEESQDRAAMKYYRRRYGECG